MFAALIDINHVVLGGSTPTCLMPCIENEKQHLVLGIYLLSDVYMGRKFFKHLPEMT